MELDTYKIKMELERIGKNQAWLARQAKVHRSLVKYWLDNKVLKAAEKIGEILRINPRDLIK